MADLEAVKELGFEGVKEKEWVTGERLAAALRAGVLGCSDLSVEDALVSSQSALTAEPGGTSVGG